MDISVKEPHIPLQKRVHSHEPRGEFVLQCVDLCCGVLRCVVGCCRAVPMSSTVIRSMITAFISCASGCVAPLSWAIEVRTNTPVAGIDPCMYDIDASNRVCNIAWTNHCTNGEVLAHTKKSGHTWRNSKCVVRNIYAPYQVPHYCLIHISIYAYIYIYVYMGSYTYIYDVFMYIHM